MTQSFGSRGPLIRVQCEESLQKVHSQGVCTTEVLGKVLPRFLWDLLDILPCTGTGNFMHELVIRCSNQVKDLVQLINVFAYS